MIRRPPRSTLSSSSAASDVYKRQELIGLAPYEIASLGIGYAPEGSAIFSDLTVEENIQISTWTRKTGRSGEERIETALEIFPVLRKYLRRKGDHMSGGERKMLSIARALALDPEFLVLDEPFEGLSPAIIPQVAEGVSAITKMGHSVLMAESNIAHVPEWAAKVFVIERGEIIFEGRPAEVYEHKEVLDVIGGSGNDERICTT